ncbi:MAG: hypothetical protein LR015_12370 [Verrucomicrobia bacterium]|nr:hypothetical protein [Verrucomicrobiota bacterium]
MAKVDLDLVKFILQRNEIDTRTVARVLDEIQTELQMQQAEEPPAPKVKKQFVFMLSDPTGDLEGKDYTGWVLQIPEEDSPLAAEERLFRSAYEFNITPKGRRMPVKTIAETCEVVSTRITKEQNIWIKTKEPVLVVRTSNKIPMEKIEKLRNE